MKRILFVVLSCIFCACSGAELAEQTEDQSQAVTPNIVTAWNTNHSISNPANSFCHMTSLGSVSSSTAAMTITTTSISAFPGTGYAAYAEAQCNTASDFGTTGISSSGETQFQIQALGGPTNFSQSMKLWDGNSVCYLTHIQGLAHAADYVALQRVVTAGVPTGWQWWMAVGGNPNPQGFGFSAMCTWLGRPWTYRGTTTAYSGETKQLGMAGNDGACFLSAVVGNLDTQGGAYVRVQNGQWTLQVYDLVYSADAYCVKYVD